jgi:hypothetical protein
MQKGNFMEPDVIPVSMAYTVVVIMGLMSLAVCVGSYAKGRMDERKKIEDDKEETT